jgi:hypothetical protein
MKSGVAIDPMYEGTFKYIYVPADNTFPITEHDITKSGGLEQDALRLLAENHFSSGKDNTSMGPSVEIVSLLLPSPQYNFIGVSMYCDSVGKLKELTLNERATSLSKVCNHADPIYGDVFFGKFHDDESKPWQRLDFTMDDMSSQAEWCKKAQEFNKRGRSGGYSTSSVLQNMLKQGNTQFIDGEQEPNVIINKDTTESDIVTWNQTEDEIEVKVQLPVLVKSSELNIQIKPKSLQILLKSGVSIPSTSSSDEKINKIFQAGGAEFAKRIDTDSSAWQLEKSKDGKQSIIVLTLAKDSKGNWSSLLG